MAISKANPSATTTGSASEVIGKDISIFSLDYIVAIDGSAGPSGAQQAVLQARIQALGTVDGVDLSGTTATAQALSIAVGA